MAQDSKIDSGPTRVAIVGGVERVLHLRLEEEELGKLRHSADILKEMTRKVI